MIQRFLSATCLAALVAAMALTLTGCSKHEHRSYRRYEGPAEHRPQPGERTTQEEGEWEMEDPGEMVFEP